MIAYLLVPRRDDDISLSVSHKQVQLRITTEKLRRLMSYFGGIIDTSMS